MTVLQIQNYVWSLCDDLSGNYFTSAELLIYINQATQETQKKLILSGNNWYITVSTAAIAVGQVSYSPPVDCLKINRLESVLNPGANEERYPLTSITLNQKDDFYLDSDSMAWFFVGNDIHLTPTPKTARILRYYYTYRVPQLTLTSETPDVPSEFHEYIANLVVQRCFLKDGRNADLVERQIQQVEENLKADAIERAQDHASTVVIVENDYAGY